MSEVGKLFARVLIKKVRAGTECAIGEEQYMFKYCRGYMDQVFAVRHACVKYLANEKYIFWAFLDLEKTYETTDQQRYVADAKSL